MGRQDKIVIIAGIIILVIAGVGIVYHEQAYVASEDVEKISYRTTWRDYSDYITEEGYLDKDGWQNEYKIHLKQNAVIYRAEVQLDWTDDRNAQGLFLPWNWSDNIEVNVDVEELQFSLSDSKYEGPITLIAQKDKPKDIILEEINQTEMENIISNEEREEINCKITLSIIPKPKFLDKGNNFTLKITYHYCLPETQTI